MTLQPEKLEWLRRTARSWACSGGLQGPLVMFGLRTRVVCWINRFFDTSPRRGKLAASSIYRSTQLRSRSARSRSRASSSGLHFIRGRAEDSNEGCDPVIVCDCEDDIFVIVSSPQKISNLDVRPSLSSPSLVIKCEAESIVSNLPTDHGCRVGALLMKVWTIDKIFYHKPISSRIYLSDYMCTLSAQKPPLSQRRCPTTVCQTMGWNVCSIRALVILPLTTVQLRKES